MTKLKNVEVIKYDKEGNIIRRGKYPNMFVDDGKEYIMDLMFGRHTWHNYDPNRNYDPPNDVNLWTLNRYAGAGICMFNNKSPDRAAGLNAIPSGSCNYPIAETYLVSPEDSFLSRPVGNHIQVECTRRDRTVEISAKFSVPGDIPTGAELREFGLFLGATPPTHDPSYHDGSKPLAMMCRTVIYGTGICNGTGVYLDRPFDVEGDVEFRWIFGDL